MEFTIFSFADSSKIKADSIFVNDVKFDEDNSTFDSTSFLYSIRQGGGRFILQLYKEGYPAVVLEEIKVDFKSDDCCGITYTKYFNIYWDNTSTLPEKYQIIEL